MAATKGGGQSKKVDGDNKKSSMNEGKESGGDRSNKPEKTPENKK